MMNQWCDTGGILLSLHRSDTGTEHCCALDISMGTSRQEGREDPVGVGVCSTHQVGLYFTRLHLSGCHRCVRPDGHHQLCREVSEDRSRTCDLSIHSSSQRAVRSHLCRVNELHRKVNLIFFFCLRKVGTKRSNFLISTELPNT